MGAGGPCRTGSGALIYADCQKFLEHPHNTPMSLCKCRGCVPERQLPNRMRRT